MSLRIITARAQTLMNKSREVKQPFKYLLVLDFEATCEKDVPIQTPEIIEFPCLALNTDTWEIDNTFHKYIKPKVNSTLTDFCTDLTGISQEIVDDEDHFPETFKEFCNWFEKNKFNEDDNKGAFVTCGDWDLKVMLPNQCALDNLPVPDYFKKWINLKTTYCEMTQHYPRSLRDMMVRLKLPFEGRLHSGLHDSLNMARIIQTLVKTYNAKISLNSSS